MLATEPKQRFFAARGTDGVAPGRSYQIPEPYGTGSIQDQVTAEMTSELMKVMGIAGRQTAQEVKRIRDNVGKDSE